MKTFVLRSQFFLQRPSNLTNPTANPSFPIPFRTVSYLKHPTKPSLASVSSGTTILARLGPELATKGNHTDWISTLEFMNKTLKPSAEEEELRQACPSGYPKFVMLGAFAVGIVLFLAGMDDQKALALGPEGPLMEEFWDNVRRYALYVLTVSTGAIYTVFQPILELLKNPISAILVLTIIGGSIYIVSQVLSFMLGVSDFSYDYGY